MPPTRRDLTVAVLSVRSAPARVDAPSGVQTAAGRIRAGLRDAAAVLPDGPRGLLPGLVDGDVSGLDPQLAADFKTAGLSHLTAVSGTNVAIVTGAVLLLLRGLTVGPRTSAVGAGVALAGIRGAGPALAERAAGGGDGGDRAAGARVGSAAVGVAGARSGGARAGVRLPAAGAGSRASRCPCWRQPG